MTLKGFVKHLEIKFSLKNVVLKLQSYVEIQEIYDSNPIIKSINDSRQKFSQAFRKFAFTLHYHSPLPINMQENLFIPFFHTSELCADGTLM